VRVGLTGGIGAGKSAVAAILGELGAFVVDTDAVARPGRMTIDIEVAGLGDASEYVANCMRQVTGVELVLTV
jgi:dephospho-CoA kinase